MLARAWEILKATLAACGLIAAALVSADKLDRMQASNAAAGLALTEPAATGAITPR